MPILKTIACCHRFYSTHFTSWQCLCLHNTYIYIWTFTTMTDVSCIILWVQSLRNRKWPSYNSSELHVICFCTSLSSINFYIDFFRSMFSILASREGTCHVHTCFSTMHDDNNQHVGMNKRAIIYRWKQMNLFKVNKSKTQQMEYRKLRTTEWGKQALTVTNNFYQW